MLKFSENSTQNMPKLPIAGVLGGADTCNGRKHILTYPKFSEDEFSEVFKV